MIFMNTKNFHTEKLFSYGTLQYEAVQLSTFGRKLNGKPDVLAGYQLSTLKISNPDVVATSGEATHPVLVKTNNEIDQVKGIVFDISSEELQQADKYEAADYKRVSVQLHSGCSAWVYVSNHGEE
jgi:gamma-glutamylcyclotransferase (GGCT)/AIG2-like uncharacterized protein YtfP